MTMISSGGTSTNIKHVTEDMNECILNKSYTGPPWNTAGNHWSTECTGWTGETGNYGCI